MLTIVDLRTQLVNLRSQLVVDRRFLDGNRALQPETKTPLIQDVVKTVTPRVE